MTAPNKSTAFGLLLVTIGLGACGGSEGNWTQFRSTFAPELSLSFRAAPARPRDYYSINACDSAYFTARDALIEEFKAWVDGGEDLEGCWKVYVERLNEIELDWLECGGE